MLREAADALAASCGVGDHATFKAPRLRLVDIAQVHIVLLISPDRDSSIVAITQILLSQLHLFWVVREIDVFEKSIFLNERRHMTIKLPHSRLTAFAVLGDHRRYFVCFMFLLLLMMNL